MISNASVTAIVLAFNCSDVIVECLRSLKSSTYPVSILVIDNDSSDNTLELVNKHFPDVNVKRAHTNLGYSGGNNLGLKIAIEKGTKYAFIVNPDVRVEKECIKELVNILEHHPLASIASPKTYYGWPSNLLWFAGATIDWEKGLSPHTGFREEDIGQYDTLKQIDRANGGAMLVRLSSTSSIGLLDEKYFLYFEETDWSVRMVKAGFEIYYVPTAVCHHAVSSSTGGEGSALYWYYMTRNNLLFMSKHGRTFRKSFSAYLRQSSWGNIKHWLKNPSFESFHKIFATMKGYTDYYLGRFGKRSF